MTDTGTIAKIHHFATFKKGWHYTEGEVFEQSVLDKAVDLAEYATGLEFETDAFPGTGGGVMITLYWDDFDCDFSIHIDGTWTFCRQNKDCEVYQEGLSFQDAKDKIKGLMK